MELMFRAGLMVTARCSMRFKEGDSVPLLYRLCLVAVSLPV
jgi:hypothetical protein